MAAEIVTSSPVVSLVEADMRVYLSDRVPSDDMQPTLSVAASFPEQAATHSYLRRMQQAAGRVGLAFNTRYTPHNDDALMTTVEELNEKRGSGTMVMMPLSDPSREHELRTRINSHRDPDALGWVPDENGIYPEGYPNYPATPLSVLRLAEHGLGESLETLIGSGQLEPERIVFFGKGRLVNAPGYTILERLLQNLGIDERPTVISRENRNTDLVEQIGDRADLVLAAVGVTQAAGIIKPEYLRRPHGSQRDEIVVIDAAFCTGQDGRFYGNLHPSVYDPTLDFAPKVTPWSETYGPIKGVGPLTASFLLQHTIQAAQRDSNTTPSGLVIARR